MAVGRILYSLIWLFLLTGCGSPPEEIRSKLWNIGKDDLSVIVGELPDQTRQVRLSIPYFVLDDYKEFHGDTARVFQAYASLAFFYLDPSIDLCQTRKYRYRRAARVWERYESLLRHFPPRYLPSGPIPDSFFISGGKS